MREDLQTEWKQKMSMIYSALTERNYCFIGLCGTTVLVVADDIEESQVPRYLWRSFVVYSLYEIEKLKKMIDAGIVDESGLRFIHECKKVLAR